MKTITTVITRSVDLDAGICHPHKLHKKLIRGNAFAHAFKVACYRDGEPVDISNATCWGYVRRADGETIELEGTVKGNTAQIILSAACYLILGWATISLELELDGVSATHGIWLAEVRSSRSDHVTDGEPVIPETLPNPFPLIFTGAVNAVYDGSELVYVHIPTGGSVPDEPVVPAYWQSHVDARVADVNNAYAQAGSDKSTFLFYSDAHWTYNYQQSPNLLAYLTRNTPIQKVFFGGDVIQDEDELSYIDEWRAAVSELPCHHSVAGNHDDSIDDTWTLDTVYQFLLEPEVTNDVVRGADLYYHIDVAEEKTRYLFLDTATKNGNILDDPAQEAWLKNTLLSTPAGWHIVAVSHIWVTVDYDVNPPVATGISMGGQICLDMFDAYNAREGDFAACTGRVEFCIGGHAHVDADYASADGIPVILVETDSRNLRSGGSCTSGTTTENSVNAIVADYTNGFVNVIRIGRGVSRTVSLDGTGSEPDVEDTTWMTTSITRTLQTSDDTVAIEWGNNVNGVTYVVFDGDAEVARVADHTQTVLFGVTSGDHVYKVRPQKSDSELGNLSDGVTLTVVADVGYTNVLRLATDADGKPYNGGLGYKENVRISASDYLEKTVTGWDSTGYFPITPGDIVRLYNMDYYDLDDAGGSSKRNFVFGYDDNRTDATVSTNPLADAWSPVLDADGDLIQFKMVNNWSHESFLRITAKNIDAFSIITVNEEINI